MLSLKCPSTPLKISLLENKTTINLKSDSFIVIMHLHEDLTHIQSQKKPRLHFSKSCTLSSSATIISYLDYLLAEKN